MHQKEVAEGKTKGWFEKYLLFGMFPYPNRLKWALAPMRILQALKLDKVIDASGVTRLLPKKLQRMHSLLPRLQPKGEQLAHTLPAIGPQRARVGFFTGCVSEAMFSQTNRATVRVLQQNGCEVVIPESQNCCGAIHYHGGEPTPALEMALRNAEAFAKEELDAVIINVAGCGAMLKDYHHMAEELAPGDEETKEKLTRFVEKVKDVSEFLAEIGLVPPEGEIPMRVTYHDACHLVHAQKVRQQPRDLLANIPKLELVPLAESDICCGAAGSYNLTQPEMADQLGQRKLENIRKANPQAVLAGNAGCSLQLQTVLKQAGYDLPVYHPVDLLDASYRGVLPR